MTVSLDPSVIASAKSQAAQYGMAASAWVARLIRQAAVAEPARRYDEFERETGAEMVDWDGARVARQAGCLAGAEW